MTRGTRNTGEFCWVNMLTPKPAEARAFFADVLGWTFFEMPGVGHGIRVAGRDIGGLYDVVSPRTPAGTAPILGVMIRVSDVDATQARANDLGGKAEPAFDISDAGRLSVCFDPTGAELDLWQAKNMQGTDVDSALPGAPVWFELMTIDLDRAVDFYSHLFGWTAHAQPEPRPGMRYTVFQRSGSPAAGALQITPAMGAMRSRWRTYFSVADIETSVSRATARGATIDMAIRDVPGGRIAGLTSPQGVEFCVSERTS